MSRIFISYGRADAQDLASRLEEDLRAQGHKIWLDRNEIKAGRAWEEEIETGLLGSDIVIALLSPHAVRRPDGVCLDEISLARYNRRRIIPIMVLPCRPPLGIYRLDWIDFRNWRTAADYYRSFARLTSTIQEKTDLVEGTYAAMFSKLKPMDFGNEVSRLTRGFVGREWLFDQVAQWLTHDESRMFLITGDPGIGKSAFLASLIHKHPQICGYHFCVSDLADSLDPFLFVKSIAAQFATQFDSYRAALEALDLEIERAADPGILMRRLIADPLNTEVIVEPVLIALDALDESIGYPGRNIAKVVSERIRDLPPFVRFVASTRNNAEILDLFSSYSPHPINATQDHNLRDANSYLDMRLTEPDMFELLKNHRLAPSAIKDAILSRSEGNFLYLRHTLDALQAGQIDPRLTDTFPNGLIGVYHSFFERIFPNPTDFFKFRPLLDVVAVSREPLMASQIGKYTNFDPFDIEQELQRVADFFPERDGRYQAFHKSMLDWLLGFVGHSRRFQVNKRSGHQLIGEQCWREYQNGADAMSAYAVKHGLYHLHHAGRSEEVVQLAADPQFIWRRLRLGRGIFFSHSYRSEELDLPRQLAYDLQRQGHILLIDTPVDIEDKWRQNLASNMPSASIAIGFTYNRNSPYLREEWMVALASGVPLVLIMVEDSLWLSDTPEFAKVPCIDMRQWKKSEADYSRAWSQLLDLVGKGPSEKLGSVITLQDIYFDLSENINEKIAAIKKMQYQRKKRCPKKLPY